MSLLYFPKPFFQRILLCNIPTHSCLMISLYTSPCQKLPFKQDIVRAASQVSLWLGPSCWAQDNQPNGCLSSVAPYWHLAFEWRMRNLQSTHRQTCEMEWANSVQVCLHQTIMHVTAKSAHSHRTCVRMRMNMSMCVCLLLPVSPLSVPNHMQELTWQSAIC